MYIWRRGNVDLLLCETHAVHVRCIWQGPARYTLCTSNESYREGAYIIIYTLCVHVYGVSHAEGACAAELAHGGKWDGMVPSAGGCDERIRLYLLRKHVTPDVYAPPHQPPPITYGCVIHNP